MEKWVCHSIILSSEVKKMCNPAAVMGIQAAGMAYSAMSNYQQGIAQKNYYDYAATQSEKQAILAEKQGVQAADNARDVGAESTKSFKRQAAQLEGAQKVAIGANLGSGSKTAEQIVGDTFDKEKMDEMAIKYNADVEAWRAVNEANLKSFDLRSQAAGYRMAGKQAKKAGKIGAINDLLSGAGQVAGTWYAGKMSSPSAGRTASVSGRRVPVAPSGYYSERING